MEQELKMNEMVTITNLCDYPVYFKREEAPNTDVKLKANNKFKITRSEIQAQVYAGNRLFVGEDGTGRHARIFIEDEPLRILVGLQSEDGKSKQDILNAEKVKAIFTKSASTLQKELNKHVVTQREINFTKKWISDNGFNEYDKLKIFEAHCNKTIK